MEAAAAARNMDSMESMEEEPEEEPDPLIEYFQQPQMPAWMMQARDHNPTCESSILGLNRLNILLPKTWCPQADLQKPRLDLDKKILALRNFVADGGLCFGRVRRWVRWGSGAQCTDHCRRSPTFPTGAATYLRSIDSSLAFIIQVLSHEVHEWIHSWNGDGCVHSIQ